MPQGAAWRPSSGSMSSCVGVFQCLYKSDAQFPKMSPPFSHLLVSADGQESEGQFVVDRKSEVMVDSV